MDLSNVAVVGLLPTQAQVISRDFPGSRLRFIPREREREVSRLVENFDHVVVMTKFIDHATYHQVPREKLLHVNGGISELRRSIKRLEKDMVKKERAVATTDYSAMRTAEPGQVLTFPLPAGVKMDAFEKQVGASRSYYKRQHRLETEQKTVGSEILVTVNGIRSPAPLTQATETPKPLTEFTDSIKRLWTEAYLSFGKSLTGATDALLAEKADGFIEAYRKRFGE